MTSNLSRTSTELVETSYPSRTYALDIKSGRISGFVDNQEAYIQFVNKLIQTERYAYVIYSEDYGVEIESLIGQDFDYVKATIKANIIDALLADDRTVSVTDFSFKGTDFDSLTFSFWVTSIYGSTEITA